MGEEIPNLLTSYKILIGVPKSKGWDGSWPGMAADVYPNQPNVRRYHVKLDDALFDDPRFDVSTIGPFVLAIRKPITI